MKENFKALDGLRGLTALYVLIHHARLALTQAYQNGLGLHPEKYEWYDKFIVYFFGLFKFGQEAVIVFFVLSGFLIHLRQAKPNFNFDEFRIRYYLKKRVIRIYPTLLISFLLCLILDYIFYLFTGNSFVSIFSKYDLYGFISNLFLIPTTNSWGNNFPIWSLKHEWFFYLIYPLLLWIGQKHFIFPLLIVVGLYLSYILGFRIPYIGSVAYTLMIWGFGGMLAEIYQRKNKTLLRCLPYLTMLLFFYFFINRSEQYFPFLEAACGLIVMGILSFILTNPNHFTSIILTKVAWLGTFSYSIYLLHMPFINLYQSIILANQTNHELPYHLWYVTLSIIITLPIIYLIYYYTERLAINYKKKI